MVFERHVLVRCFDGVMLEFFGGVMFECILVRCYGRIWWYHMSHRHYDKISWQFMVVGGRGHALGFVFRYGLVAKLGVCGFVIMFGWLLGICMNC